MDKPKFFTIMRTKAIWIGISWCKWGDKLELNFNIPFITFSFYF